MKKCRDHILFYYKRTEISRLSIRISPMWKNSKFLITVKRMEFRLSFSHYFLKHQLHFASRNDCAQKKASSFDEALVVPPGLEPGLFGTKNRRVANYTIGQFHNVPETSVCLLRVQM